MQTNKYSGIWIDQTVKHKEKQTKLLRDRLTNRQVIKETKMKTGRLKANQNIYSRQTLIWTYKQFGETDWQKYGQMERRTED